MTKLHLQMSYQRPLFFDYITKNCMRRSIISLEKILLGQHGEIYDSRNFR